MANGWYSGSQDEQGSIEVRANKGEERSILAIEPETCFHEPRNPLASPISAGSLMSAAMMMQMSS